MGEIADMMLDGILCEHCGAYVGDEVGYPRLCDACEDDKVHKSDQEPKKEDKDERRS